MIASIFFPRPTQARRHPDRGRFRAARQVPASECDPLANGIDLSLLEHTAQSNGTMSCSTANISSIGSSSASAVAQKGSSLAYKITRISLVGVSPTKVRKVPQKSFLDPHTLERSLIRLIDRFE